MDRWRCPVCGYEQGYGPGECKGTTAEGTSFVAATSTWDVVGVHGPAHPPSQFYQEWVTPQGVIRLGTKLRSLMYDYEVVGIDSGIITTRNPDGHILTDQRKKVLELLASHEVSIIAPTIMKPTTTQIYEKCTTCPFVYPYPNENKTCWSCRHVWTLTG